MGKNQRLKVHRQWLPGRSLCSIRSNRKWCKRRGSSLECQNCFFVYPIIDSNLKNLVQLFSYFLLFIITQCIHKNTILIWITTNKYHSRHFNLFRTKKLAFAMYNRSRNFRFRFSVISQSHKLLCNRLNNLFIQT